MKNFIYKNFNNIYYNFLFLVVAIFFLTKLSISYQEILGTNKWAYSNLLINYSAGFVRRGLFGEIFINIHDVFNMKTNEMIHTLLSITNNILHLL